MDVAPLRLLLILVWAMVLPIAWIAIVVPVRFGSTPNAVLWRVIVAMAVVIVRPVMIVSGGSGLPMDSLCHPTPVSSTVHSIGLALIWVVSIF